MSASPTHPSFRRMLAVSTALGGFLALPVAAQTIALPTDANIQDVRLSALGSSPQLSLSNNDTKLNINLRAQTTVIDWQGFNIPEDHTINFSNGRIVPGGAAVLNRDVSTNSSQLLGNLTSARDVSVWVYNGNGILAGSKSVFNTGSLVLSTLDISPADFIASSNNFRLRSATGTEQSAITIANGAKITVDGETRGLVMVAPKIQADGEFVAKGQDVAFVAASDVTMAYGAGSPLSVTINRGTAVVGPSQVVQGTVEGNNVLFALASQDTITNALLQVNADVTSVSAGSRGIVLSAGRTSGVGGVTLGSDVPATGGIVATSINGTLSTQGSNSNFVLAGTGAVAVQGEIGTRGDATIIAGGALAMTGSITALDDVRLTGAGIAFGGAISPNLDETSITAADQVQLVSTGGDITATGPLLLRSGASGNDSLAIETRGTAGGDILLGDASNLVAGSDRGGALSLRLRDGANAVTLGNVAARGIRSAVGGAATTNGLRTTGLVSIGNASVRDTLAIDAGGITGGVLLSDGAITLASTSAITVDGLDARSGSMTATATGAITVRALARASGTQSDLVIDTVGDVSVGIASAGRDLLIGSVAPAATVAIPGLVGAGRNYRVDANAIVLGNGEAVQQSAYGSVTLTAGSGGITGLAGLTLLADAAGGSNGMTLAIDAARAAGVGGAIDFAADTRLLGGGGRTSDIRIRSADAAGIVALGNVSARNLLGAVASNAYATGVTRTGALRAGDVTVRGNLLLSGAGIVTGRLDSEDSIGLVATTDAISTGRLGAGDAITANAVGALSVNGDVLANDDITLGGASVTLGGTMIRGGGSIDVLARAGGILSTEALAIESTSSNRGDFIRLGAAGPEGVVLGAGSTITNANRAVGVRIFTASDTPLVLGDVVARSLGTLATIYGDPFVAGGAFRSQGSLLFGRLNLVQGFAGESVAGDLSVEAIEVTGSGQGIDLRAGAGTLSVPSNLSASGAVTLISGSALTLGVVESRNAALALSSGGVLTTGALSGATGVTASGTSATLGAVSGGTGAVEMTASGGDLAFAGAQGSAITLKASNGAIDAGGPLMASAGAISAVAGGSIIADGGVTATGGGVSLVSAGGPLSAAGGVRAGRDVTLAGTAITIGGVNEARGSYTATASAGGIVRTGDGGSIRSDSDSTGGEGISLAATGGAIALADTPLSAGTGAVKLTTNGGGINVGAVDATRLTAIGATTDGAIIRTGDMTLARGLDLSAAGAVRTGLISVTNGAVTVASGAGDVTTGAISASGNAALSGTAVTFGDVTAAGFTAQASTGAISGGAITSAGAVQVGAAAAVTLGRVASSTGSVVITGAGPISVNRVTAGGAARVTGSVLDADVMIAEGVDAVGAATVRSGGDILTPFVISRTSDLTVAAPNGRVAGLQPNTGTDLQAGPGGAFSLTVGEDADLGNVSGDNISIIATSIIADSIAGGSEAVTLRATAGDLSVTGPVTGSDVSLTSVGNTLLGSVDASGAVTIGGEDSLSFGIVSGTSITATGGIVTGVALRSPGAIDVRAAAVSLNAVEAGTLLADASNSLTIDTVVTTGGTKLTSGGVIGLDTVSAGGALGIDAGTTLGFTSLSGASIGVAGATINGGTLSAASAVDLSGTDVTVGAIDANTLTAVAAKGLALGTVRTTGDTTLTSGGAIGLDTVSAGGALKVDAGTTLGFTSLSGASIGIAGATINGGALNADGAIDLSGTDVTVGAIDANTLTAVAANGLALGTVRTTGDTTLTSGGAIGLDTVSAGGALKVDAGTTLGFTSLSGASIGVAGATINGGTLSAAGAVDLSGTDVTVGAIDASTLTAVAANGLGLGTVRTTGDTTLTSGGAIGLDTVSAGGALKVDAGTTLGFTSLSGASIGIAGATINGGALNADGAIDLSGTDVTVGAVDARTLTAAAGNALALGTVRTTGDTTLMSGGATGLDTVAASGALAVDAGTTLRFTSLSGASIGVAGAAINGETLSAVGAVDMSGTDMSVGAVEAKTLTATAINGLAIDVVTAVRDVTLKSGVAELGTVSVGGALSIDTTNALTFDRLVGNSVIASGGTVRGEGIDADAAVSVRGTTVQLGSIDAGRDITARASDAVAIGTIAAGGDVTVGAGNATTIGGVSAGGAYQVTGGTVLLGGVQRAAGEVRVVATLGAVRGNEGLSLASGAAMVLDGAGGLSLGGTTLRASGALGLRAGSGTAIRLGAVDAASIGGFDGTAIIDRVRHDASFEAGDVNAGPIAITLSAGDLTLGRVIGRGGVSLAAQSVRTGALEAASLDAKATNGLTFGTTTVGGNAALTGASVTTPSVKAGAITISTVGTLSDGNSGRTALRTTSGDLAIDAGSAQLATIDSAGAATLRVGTIDVAGRLTAARQLLVDARRALTLGDANAGGEMSLKSADAVIAGSLTAAGKLAVDGTVITLGSASATAGIALDASGLVRSGALSGGPSVTVRGADAELSGAVRATDVRFATRDPATSTLRVGDGTAAGGFRLSASEVGLIAAETLGFDAGSGAMEIGTMALTPTIAKSVAMLSTGEVRVSGQLSSSGGAQAIRIGGGAAQGNAQTIHVVATSDAGGRIYAEGADVELRGNRIAVGLAPGFIDTLQPGDAGSEQAAALIGNANSALYNPLLGATVYSPDATTTLAARSLTVRFGDYALFQNTGIPGSTSAVTLGSLAMPVLPALRVSTFGAPATASFALFGTINGISGASTALLGNPVIEIDPLLLANSRINGCLARSGAGCLTTIVIQPTLQVFNWNSEAVFGIRQDVSLPFSPIIGSNNEELLGGLPALAPEQLGTGPTAAQSATQSPVRSNAQPQESKP